MSDPGPDTLSTNESPAKASGVVDAWLKTAPVVPVITAVGMVLTVVLWWGLRSIESDQAQVDHERQFLAQSTGFQQRIGDLTAELEERAAFQSIQDSTPTPAALRLQTEHLGPVAFAELVENGAEAEKLAESERTRIDPSFTLQFDTGSESASYPRLVLTRVVGTETGLEIIGSDIGATSGLFSELQQQTVTDRQTKAHSGISALDFLGDPSKGVILATPVTSGEGNDVGVRGVLMLWVDAVGLADSSGDPASTVVVSFNGRRLGAGVANLGEPFGEPNRFSAVGAEWEIQGFRDGSGSVHWTSWLALLAGSVLTLSAAGFARSVRRHAMTLGRLQRSEFDARHDELTGLLNRAGITAAVNELVAQRKPQQMVGLLFCDLDRLKVVNDSIGHSAGDEVLVAVAERLRRVVRPDDVIGRFGGDEFVIATLGLPAVSDLERLAERLLASLKEPVILSDHSAQIVSASVGIAVSADQDGSSESLLRDADSAMYRAKDAGGASYIVFDSELRAQAVARLEVERELRRAIRKGQLVVHYQPIVDLADGSVKRVEALVRWAHPERGMIPPGQFLSVAAESGLIVDLGEVVLREACQQAANWSEALGRDLLMSVNVAERQLLDSTLIDTVRKVLAETGLSAHQLELEISEELIVEKLDGRLDMLRDLVAMGVKLAIDDFGTSRASLSQLKTLDMVHTLKIDRAFVNDVATDEVDRNIVTAIVALAKSVKMEIVAEGVEDPDQATVLNELGVDQIQGFYFARPAAHDQILGLLSQKFDLPWKTVPSTP